MTLRISLKERGESWHYTGCGSLFAYQSTENRSIAYNRYTTHSGVGNRSRSAEKRSNACYTGIPLLGQGRL
jgi:hypothetical protein